MPKDRTVPPLNVSEADGGYGYPAMSSPHETPTPHKVELSYSEGTLRSAALTIAVVWIILQAAN